MSIVAWDGKSIAADEMTVSSGMRKTDTKIFRVEEKVVAWVGEV